MQHTKYVKNDIMKTNRQNRNDIQAILGNIFGRCLAPAYIAFFAIAFFACAGGNIEPFSKVVVSTLIAFVILAVYVLAAYFVRARLYRRMRNSIFAREFCKEFAHYSMF